MVGHVVNGNELLPLSRDDAGHVLLQFVFMFWFDQVLPSLDRKDNVEVNLGVGVCHFNSCYAAPMELGLFGCASTINIAPLTGLKD